MDFALTAAEQALADTARDYLVDHYPVDAIAEWADPAPHEPATGAAARAWRDLVDLGWLDDLGAVELAILAEQVGWALYPGPWLSTVALAAPAFRAGGCALPGPATLAWAEPVPGPWRLTDVARVGCRATGGATVALTGRKTLVPDAARAAEIVVAAVGSEGPALYAVAAADLTVATPSGTDPTRMLGVLDLAATPARMLVDAAATPKVVDGIRRRALMLFAAEAVGVAARALDMAVRYAQIRTQFGRPIGANQAIAHRLADGYADVELARSLVYRAACRVAIDEGGDRSSVPGHAPAGAPTADSLEATESALAATVAAREAALHCGEAAIQTLGATGFSWDHPAHRWYRRARWIAGFDGFAPVFRAELAGLLLDDVVPGDPAPVGGTAQHPAEPAADAGDKHCVSADFLVR